MKGAGRRNACIPLLQNIRALSTASLSSLGVWRCRLHSFRHVFCLFCILKELVYLHLLCELFILLRCGSCGLRQYRIARRALDPSSAPNNAASGLLYSRQDRGRILGTSASYYSPSGGGSRAETVLPPSQNMLAPWQATVCGMLRGVVG